MNKKGPIAIVLISFLWDLNETEAEKVNNNIAIKSVN